VSRVEGFSDAVFAFAVTLLVVSLEVPKTFDELLMAIRGFPAFAVSFALLFQIWWRHYRFFRRYDLEDAYVIAVTGFLLFVVLFYVYPLKFLWASTLSQFNGRARAMAPSAREVSFLFVIYGAGMAAAYGLLAALYRHAYARRAALDLTAADVIDTRVDIYRNVAVAGIGLLSAAVALLFYRLSPAHVGWAGAVYFAIGLSEWQLGEYKGRAHQRLPSPPSATLPM
jgi:uncharacterized membrane protein